MTNNSIRPGCYELMVGSQTGVHSPLAPEGARSGPRKKRSERKENYRKRQARGPQLHLPKVPLPQDSVSDSDENDAPASALVHLLCRLLLLMDKKKRQHPEDPTGNKKGEGICGHDCNCSSAGISRAWATPLRTEGSC